MIYAKKSCIFAVMEVSPLLAASSYAPSRRRRLPPPLLIRDCRSHVKKQKGKNRILAENFARFAMMEASPPSALSLLAPSPKASWDVLSVPFPSCHTRFIFLFMFKTYFYFFVIVSNPK